MQKTTKDRVVAARVTTVEGELLDVLARSRVETVSRLAATFIREGVRRELDRSLEPQESPAEKD